MLDSKRSDALILSKTVTFFASQDATAKTSGELFPQSFPVSIPETAATIKSAYIEINGISYNSSGTQNIAADLDGAGLKNFTIPGSARAQEFKLNYDVTSLLLASTNTYTLNLTGISTGGIFSIFSAKLVMTYEYDSVQNTLSKTTEFFVGQENSKALSDSVISKNFSISIPDQSPAIKSAFIEISGIIKGSGNDVTMRAGLYNSGSLVAYKNTYNMDLGSQNSSARFTLQYNALSDISTTNNDYVLHFTANRDINLWNARLYLTYEYSGASGYPITGYVISSTFDTGVDKGAAFNSIMWNGSANGGAVRLQLATSNCQNGKTNPPTCDDSGAWTYLGQNCLDSSYYSASFGIAQEIQCFDNHNNKRYFRYKVILCSDPSCTISGSNNPQVDDVVVNWAS